LIVDIELQRLRDGHGFLGQLLHIVGEAAMPMPLRRPADALSSFAQFRAGQGEDSMKFFRLTLIASIVSTSSQLTAQFKSDLALRRWRRRMLRAMRLRSRQ
jgi:hypothetical protein